MSGSSAFVDSLIGSRIAGRYVIDRQLGTGGMGIVAAGRYPELGQRVAVKFLRPEHADDRVLKERFLREARVAAKVKSPHFVRVFDVGTLDSGVPYLVMEMLTGKDLADELRARGPFSVEEAVDAILQACAGIAELHGLGVVHRDLKPSNLFVTEGAGTRTIKVLDFGISKEKVSDANKPLTATDNVLGTPQYMSPEQIKASKDVDERTDVWALGVILYELLTQKLPFVAEGPGIGELFARVLYFDPQKPREHRPELPQELEDVIMRCITRDLAARYANVGALAEALRPFAAAKSLHRIDAVHDAVSASYPARGESVAPPPRQSLAPTVAVPAAEPHVESATSTPEVSSELEAARSIDASSVDLGIAKRKRTSRAVVGVVAAAAVGAFAIAFVSARREERPTVDTAPAASPAAVASSAPLAPASTSVSPATVTTAEVTPSASASAPPIVTRRPLPTAVVVKTAPRPSPAKPGATAPAPAKPPVDPIGDRK